MVVVVVVGVKRFNGQWVYYKEHRLGQFTWQLKTRHDESNAVGKLVESAFSSAEQRTEVHAAGLPTFLQWRRSLFVCHWLQYYLSQVNSDAKSANRAGERTEFSISQHWNGTSGCGFWTNQHCGYESDCASVVSLSEVYVIFRLAVVRLHRWK